MRMLLTSDGVRDGPVRDALLDLLDRPITDCRTVAVIDAMLPLAGDKGTMLDDLQRYRSLGWASCDILTLSSGPTSGIEDRLRSADVVFAYGGTNHWLAHAWTDSGLDATLRELLEEKVYIGLSAGSMIFSRRHADAVDALDDHAEVERLGLTSVGPALPLFDWLLVPHLGAPYFPFATDEWAARTAARLGAPVWFLADGAALVVRDPDGEPEVVSSSHWLRFDADGVLVASG